MENNQVMNTIGTLMGRLNKAEERIATLEAEMIANYTLISELGEALTILAAGPKEEDA